MIALTPVSLNSVAVIGAHCDDIAIGAGATLMEIVRDNPDVVVHALVLSGGGTEREVEEKNASRRYALNGRSVDGCRSAARPASRYWGAE